MSRRPAKAPRPDRLCSATLVVFRRLRRTSARVTTDGHDSYRRAIRTELDDGVEHRTNRYSNNRIEQDHRGVKGRYEPMRGFKVPTPPPASVETSTNFAIAFIPVRAVAKTFQSTSSVTIPSAWHRRAPHRGRRLNSNAGRSI